MDLGPYAGKLRQELAVAADAGGADARALAERLILTLDSATRLTLLDVLSAAADEITRDLAPGSVEVRLRGGEPSFVVTPPPAEPEDAELVSQAEGSFKDSLIRMGEVMMGVRPPAEPGEPDEGGTSRVNFRPPQHLKLRIEEAAARDGLSVNAWLVRAASAALEAGSALGSGALGSGAAGSGAAGGGAGSAGGSGSAGGAAFGRREPPRAPRSGQRYTGWVR